MKHTKRRARHTEGFIRHRSMDAGILLQLQRCEGQYRVFWDCGVNRGKLGVIDSLILCLWFCVVRGVCVFIGVYVCASPALIRFFQQQTHSG